MSNLSRLTSPILVEAEWFGGRFSGQVVPAWALLFIVTAEPLRLAVPLLNPSTPGGHRITRAMAVVLKAYDLMSSAGFVRAAGFLTAHPDRTAILAFCARYATMVLPNLLVHPAFYDLIARLHPRCIAALRDVVGLNQEHDAYLDFALGAVDALTEDQLTEELSLIIVDTFDRQVF